jgi:hypothetical protein
MQSSEFLVSGWEDGSDQGCGWTREGRNGGGCVNAVEELVDERIDDSTGMNIDMSFAISVLALSRIE